ncbi:MAG: PAS domain S-box protein, partial [Bacteroidota bacterium]
VFESMMGVRITDADGTIIDANNRYCEMMGYDKQELVGGFFPDLVVPNERRESDFQKFKDFLVDQKEVSYYTQDVRKDGTYIDLIIATKFVRINEQAMVVSTFQDVSESVKFRQFFEESGKIAKVGGWAIELATGKEYWTKEMYSIYGIDDQDFDPSSGTHQAFYSDRFRKKIRNALEGAFLGTPFDVELAYVDAKGKRKWGRATGNPVYDNEKVVRVVGSFQDITDKHNTGLKLRRSNAELNSLVNSSPLAIYTLNLKGEVEDGWNEAAERIFGWSKEEVIGNRLPTLHQDDKFFSQLPKVFAEKQKFRLERQRFRKDGTLLTVTELVAPIVQGSGKVNKVVVMVEDITEKKEIETALIESEEKYRGIIESSHDLICQINGEGKIQFVNSASLNILGYNSQELIGKSFMALVTEEQQEFTIDLLEDVMSGESVDNEVLRVKRKDGTMIFLMFRAFPIRNAKGKIIGTTTSGSDITHIKRYQTELEKSIQEKEVLIKEIHHRVKNNLAIISGLFQLQSMYVDEPRLFKILHQNQARIKTIATIHEKLYQNELFTSIEVKDYLHELIRDIQSTFNGDSLHVDIEINGEATFLNVNQAVPFGILANEMITNAYKYAFEGRGVGNIEVQLTKNDNNITFVVNDDGIGLPHNFDVMTSSSLGMTLIQTVTMQLNGNLTWTTIPGEGTSFQIIFPKEKMRTWGGTQV